MPTEQDILRSATGFLATALGTGWRVDTEYHSAWMTRLFGPEEMVLLLDFRRHGRILISGVTPFAVEARSDLRNTKIGVTRERDPGAIAREITRRLLPDYQWDLQMAQETHARIVVATAARRALAAELAGLLGSRDPVVEMDGQSYVQFTANDDNGTIVLYAEDRGTVTIHRATPDTLRTIAAALGGR